MLPWWSTVSRRWWAMEGVRLSFLWRGGHDYIHTLPRRMITYSGETTHHSMWRRMQVDVAEFPWQMWEKDLKKKRQRNGGNVNIWIAFHTAIMGLSRNDLQPCEDGWRGDVNICMAFTLLSSPNREYVVGLSRNDLQPCSVRRRGDVNIWMAFHTAIISQ